MIEPTDLSPRRLALWCAIAVATSLPSPALAQPKPSLGPSSTHIFPAGGRRGSVVFVAVGGECLPPETKFDLVGENIIALQTTLQQRVTDVGEPSPRRYPTEVPITYPKQWASRISIADDAALGPVYWRLSCAQGGTCSRPFIVGDLPEYIEKESNSVLQKAQLIPLPVTVNGQISGERDVDYYRFAASAGDIISCEVLARRIGSPLDANLSILDADGCEVSVEQRYIGSDLLIGAAIRETGDYFLRISNVSFRGDPSYVYRVNISKKPFIFACFPAGGPAGSARSVTFLAMSGTDTPIEIKQTVLFPESNEKRFDHQSSWFANAVTLELDDGRSVLESEPNQSMTDAAVLCVPSTVDGRFHSERDVDWFAFEATKGERLSLLCRTRPILSSALPTMVLFDSHGKELAKSAASTSREDRRIEWQAPESGSYRLRLRDLRFGSQGGPDFIYRLTIRRATPDFTPQLAQDCVNMVVGAKVEIPVTVQRFGGFAGDVKLIVEGLPVGITAEGTTVVAKKNKTQLILWASEDVRLGDFKLRVLGRARIAGEQVDRIATAQHYGVDGEGVSLGAPTLDRMTLTVNRKPAFRLFCSEAYQYAHRGSVFLYPMEIERLNGFAGEVTLQIGDRQNRDLDGIEMFEITIPPDQTETKLPIYLPETMHINIQSQSQLYAQGHATFQDGPDREHSVLVLAEKRNMLRTLPPVVKLRAIDQRVTLSSGSEVAIRLQLERTKNFNGPMTVELLEPVSSAITADAVQIAASETEGEMIVRVSADWQPIDGASFRFRATGMMDNSIQLITEATVEVFSR